MGRKKFLFNFIGGFILVFWLFMICLLIKKNTVNIDPGTIDTTPISGLSSSISDWMEIYLGNKKVGYSVSQLSPLDDDFLLREEIFLRLNLMGEISLLHSLTQGVLDHQFLVKTFKYKMTSGVVAFEIAGTVGHEQIDLEILQGDTLHRETVKISKRPMISAGMAHFFKGRPLSPGQSFRVPFFDPSTMVQREVLLEVTGRETLTINRLKYDAFRLETEMWGQNLVLWLDKEGSILKEEGFMGLTLIRANADVARKGITGSSGDLYEQFAVRINQRLSRVDKLGYLKLKVSGLDGVDFNTALLNEGRQRFNKGALEIVKENISTTDVPGLSNGDWPREMAPFLSHEIGIESDDSEIVKTADKIVGDMDDPLKSAGRILEWVYRNTEKRPVIVMPSAKEVLKTRVGDCNEHAVLMTALLRARGIPARICIGLAYVRGKFYYHAWCEFFAGKWISVDPTMNQMPADVTHIVLVKGGLERQMEVVNLMGKIRLEVVEYRYQ